MPPKQYDYSDYKELFKKENFGLRLSLRWIVLFVGVIEVLVCIFYVFPNDFIVSMKDKAVDNVLSIMDNECLCNGENFCFKGMDNDGNTIYGTPFDCKLYDRLAEANLLDQDAINAKNHFDSLNASTWKPVFMTVVSTNHFPESKAMLETIKEHYSESKIIYFDAGLTDDQAKEIKKWPHLKYKKFNFSAYPAHLPNLKTYAFKIAQIEVFKEHKSFYYFDASVRVKGKLKHLSGVQKQEIPPVMLYDEAKHSVYSTVHPEMLKYFPMPKNVLQTTEYEANLIFFSDSPFTRRVLKWWFLCAMTEECIAPVGSLVRCNINKNDTFTDYLNCHRFDQAFFNIITLSHMFGDDKAALKYNYVAKNWTHIDQNLIDEFYTKRLKVVSYYSDNAKIDRWQ